MEDTRKNIIIMGAGIGGLSVAHELSKFKEQYNIKIFERNNEIGGMSRSSISELGPTEYCWRIYGPNYYNLREILSEIPDYSSPGKFVSNNLVDLYNYIIPDQHEIFIMNNNPQTLFKLKDIWANNSLKEKLSVLKNILYCFCLSTKRLDNMDNLSWKDYIDPDNKLPYDIKKYIVYAMAPYLGADYNKVNVPSVVKTLETFKIFNKPLSVMNGPTNEAFLNNWQKYLQNNNVEINLNSNITDILTKNNKISGIIVNNKIIGNENDIFICSLPVESISNLVMKNNILMQSSLNKTIPLSKNGYQLMTGIQLFFDKPIVSKHTAVYIPNSPWELIIEPQEAIWKSPKNIWSIGLCDTTRHGLLIKKTFPDCNEDEIAAEVWFQIKSQKSLVNLLNLGNINPIGYKLWKSYKSEPKFSTNKNTWYLRPENQTDFNNLLFATGYTKTQTDMFEMESAAESGRRAAKIINPKVNVINSNRPWVFGIHRFIDDILYSLKLKPCVGTVTFLIIFVIIYGIGKLAN